MGCRDCGAVAIPDSDPAICPECFIAAKRPARPEIGIQDEELSFERVNELVPGMLDDGDLAYGTMDGYSFHLTDLDDLAMVSRASGEPLVWLEGADSRWVNWTVYLAENQ